MRVPAKRGTLAAMEQRITLHIVGGTSRTRAEQARLAFSLDHHAEVYSDLDELLDRPPRTGVIVACEGVLQEGIAQLLERLGDEGIWVPLVAASIEPDVEDVVDAIQAGALDYMQLPLSEEELNRMLAHLQSDAGRHGEARRRLVDARRRIGSLSKREREVLDWLSEGCSNKAIARELEISPRTVEIHRANMMDKLGASHAAEAVRLRLDAGLDALPGGPARHDPLKRDEGAQMAIPLPAEGRGA